MSETGPVLDQLNLVVRDMEASVAFYRVLGLRIDDGGDPAWGRHHRSTTGDGSVDVDLDSVAFASQWDEGWPTGRAGIVTGFRVSTRDEVDRIYHELTGAGHPGQQPPYDAFWGARYAIVEDPDGNAIGIMSPADPGRRTRPPAPPGT